MCLFHVAQKDYYTKEGRRSKRLGDLSNMYQIVEDCLEDARVIENDRQIQAHDWSRILPHHETALEVYILKYNSDKSEDDEWEQVKEEVTPH